MSRSGGEPGPIWTAVDAFCVEALGIDEAAGARVLTRSRAAGLPDIAVSAAQGRLLQVLARALGARRILEIGTLGGYSSLWLAGALPAGGRLVTLELLARHAATAVEALAEAGVADRVEVRAGPAADSLVKLAAEGGEPFDFAFLDADKTSYVRYLELTIPLMRPGGLIVADNVVRSGRILEPGGDPNAQGARAFIQAVGLDPRVSASVVQTVGDKGHDGMLLAVVGPAKPQGTP